MDIVNKEGTFPHDELSAGPPTLIENTLDFGRVPQGRQKTLQQVIVNTTRQPMIWLAHAGAFRWLTLEPGHGVLQPGEQQSIRVTADTSALEAGEHTATLTFSSEGDETSMCRDTISKIMVEQAPRPLEAGLNFGGLTPHSTSTQLLQISNPDDRAVEWEIQIGTDKPGMGVRETVEHSKRPAGIRENFDITKDNGVSVSESEGSLPPLGSRTIFVTVNAAKLAERYAYMTNLTLISRIGTASTTIEVPVAFYVGAHPYNDGGPRVPLDLPPNISFTIPHGSNTGATTLSFTNAESTQVDWTLVSDATWLVPNPSSGTFDANVTDTVVLTAYRNPDLSPGNYSTDLHMTLSWHPATGYDTAVTIPVTLTVL